VPEDREAVQENIRRVQSGVDPTEVEFRVERPDGGRSWVLAHAVPIMDEEGSVERICGVVLDITERRLAEDRLRSSEARFRQICEASFDGIVVSSGGVITEVNPGFQGIFRCSAGEAVGKPVRDFIGRDPAEILETQDGRPGRGPLEIEARAVDGTAMILEATTRAHRTGGKTSHITALRDITEVRDLERQFQFSQRMEAVGRLAGGVAHDFNNLLTVIRAYADLIRESVTDESPLAKEVDEILRASDSASALTRQLLAFSRRQAVQPAVIDVGDVVRGGVRMLEPLLGEGVELSVDVPPEPLRAVMDPHQLEQVLMNLAANARDAMPMGGVLSIRASRVDLDASFARGHWDMAPGTYIRLTVSDTGVGMSEDVRCRVFEPFFTTKGHGEGTGLGLSSVYGIVRQSGGFIWVYSEPGQGATFKVHLPEVDPPVPSPSAAVEPGPVPLGGSGEETILVVEDLPAVRSAVRRILEGYGYSVLEALTPSMALDLARSHLGSVDLLLTDVVMPEMSGPDLAREVKALRPGIRVLFMSGYAPDTAHRMGALEAGADLLEKPFSAEALVGRVREALTPASSGPLARTLSAPAWAPGGVRREGAGGGGRPPGRRGRGN
ncbi:MAG TPA: PAS domain S-box protein, partial [Longimicrobiales bacterium]|nr:PAS domain S-box protein [Longimicrobiales bacterium]